MFTGVSSVKLYIRLHPNNRTKLYFAFRKTKSLLRELNFIYFAFQCACYSTNHLEISLRRNFQDYIEMQKLRNYGSVRPCKIAHITPEALLSPEKYSTLVTANVKRYVLDSVSAKK